MIRALFVGLMLWLAASLSAHAQGNVIPNCYNGPNAGGTGSTFIACPGHLATTNRSATIATGNTFQTILAAGVYSSVTIENNNTNGDSCWLFVGSGTASKAASMLLVQAGSYQRYFPFVPSDAIQATCATTSDTLYVDTQ